MLLLVLACIGVLALMATAALRRAASASAPFGCVSEQWLAEHLAAHTP